MITVDEYRERVAALGEALPEEMKPLSAAHGYVTAQAALAVYPVPPFDNSAMDGFALRSSDVSDVPYSLPVAMDIPAGSTHVQPLEPGQAARIMTGAMMPAGADTVVPVEKVENSADHMGKDPLSTVTLTEIPQAGKHVRLSGEDIEAGELAIPAGTRLGATELSALASIGIGSIAVRRQPVIGILSTGSELKAPGQTLEPGQIPDSNSTLLRSMVIEAGCTPVMLQTSGDDVADFEATLNQAGGYIDALLTTGGVSAGAFDVVKEYLSTQGVEFTKVAMQPGKPQGCGHADVAGRKIPILCFPGNPVSVYISMKLFGSTLINTLVGASTDINWVQMPANQSWHTSKGRTQFLPAVITSDGVGPATGGGSGSHLVYSLTKAHVIASVDADVDTVQRGDLVKVWIP